MSNSDTSVLDVPAILPGNENSEAREKLILEASRSSDVGDQNHELLDDELVDDELFDDEADEIGNSPSDRRGSKRKMILAFVSFVAFFVLLLGILCWFFGIGMFSKARTQTVDRSTRSDSATAAPVTEEEKLRMALSMVAQQDPDNAISSLNEPNEGDNAAKAANTETVPGGGGQTGFPEMDLESTNRSSGPETESLQGAANSNDPNQVPSHATFDSNAGPGAGANSRSGSASGSGTASRRSDRISNAVSPDNSRFENGALINSSDGGIHPAGRSLFFGRERTSTPEPRTTSDKDLKEKAEGKPSLKSPGIPFGTLLPVRLVGSVYTLRNSGGLVRMELTREVLGKGYAFPAGTVLVGTVRGSEFVRAFITINGLIDPESGGYIKVGGEVLGVDGASGLTGQRRKMTGAWSRALSALRNAGMTAVGALGNWRSAGTVVISDSAQKASEVVTNDVAGAVGGKRQANEFVEVAAGTSGFVLITDLPEVVSPVGPRSGIGNLSGSAINDSLSGLNDEELAELFSGMSKENLRTAIPRMRPDFRKAAEQVLESLESK